MMELHAYVYGRVQLVMYRDFAQRKACGLRLTGWVRNLDDGRVELVAQGERAALEKYLTKLRKGSLLSRVDRVEEEWREAREHFDNFKIVYKIR